MAQEAEVTQGCTGCHVICAWSPSYHTILPPRIIVECITLHWNIICDIFQLRTRLDLLGNFLAVTCRDKAWVPFGKQHSLLGLFWISLHPRKKCYLPGFQGPRVSCLLNGIFVFPAGPHSPNGSAVLSPCGHDKSPKVWKEGTSQLNSMTALSEYPDNSTVGL